MDNTIYNAIKYAKIKLCDDIFLLKPAGLVRGTLEENGYFKTDKEILTHISNPILDGKYIVSGEMIDEDLMELYDDRDEKDIQLVRDYYYEEQQERIIIIRDGKQVSFVPSELYDNSDKPLQIFDVIDGEDGVILNSSLIDALMKIEDIGCLKDSLVSYRDSIQKYAKKRQDEGVQKIVVEDGQIKEIAVDPVEYHEKRNQIHEVTKSDGKSETPRAFEDISLSGLETYLKERIYGHDEELETIATVLFSNFTATREDGVEAILIPGPTGTGKTATMETAAEYLGVPFVCANTINLVPQGYVGTTVEDVLYSLISANGFKEELYNRAILVFDEFDKLGKDSLDEKVTLTNIFLKLVEGAEFPISKEYKTYNVDTKMINKVFLGAFTEAFKQERTNNIGFGSSGPKTPENIKGTFNLQKLVDAGYFDRELLTRINYFCPYYELDDETKLQVILSSKLSVFQKKKKRFKREYGVDITGDEDFARGVLDALKKGDQSVRDLNNLISQSLIKPQREIILGKGSYKQLKLTRDTVATKKFELI